MTTHNYLTPLAEVRPVPGAGFGSFAIAPIPRGTVVACFGGTAVHRASFDAADEDRRSRSIQIDDDTFILGPPEREPGDCVNHSCNPNSGPRNAVQIVSMRDIAVGEEITFDYGMTDGSNYDTFQCACAHPHCRGVITGTTWAMPDMQDHYRGWFSPYLLRRINASRLSRELTKSDVEQLLDTYDRGPIAALQTALRIVLGRPHSRFADLVPLVAHDHDMRAALTAHNIQALDHLASHLNETRGRAIIDAYFGDSFGSPRNR